MPEQPFGKAKTGEQSNSEYDENTPANNNEQSGEEDDENQSRTDEVCCT